MHLSPQSFQNLETFANAGAAPCDLSMADISQQTFAMSAQLRDVGCGQSGDRLPSPRRVGGALSRPDEVGGPSQSMLGAESWLSQQVAASQACSANSMAGCADASELERLVRQQMEHAPQMAQAAQVLQNIQSQIGPFQADFLQQTMHEIAKRCAAPEGVTNEWGATAVAALANGAMPPGTAGMPGAPVDQFGAWSNWGQRPLSGAPAATSGGSSASWNKGEEKPHESQFDTNGRIEELNQYIRQQSQEYMEGQAEWSRQIAEVKSECLRELEKVRREKDEVERQARQEILRLNQRLREVGVNDEGAGAAQGGHGGDSPQQVGSWAHGVTLDEYQQVQRKWNAAEERICQLEEYIKDQSAKQLFDGDSQVKEKDEEIQKLRHVILAGGMELQQVTSELQALRTQYDQKIQLWEQGARRLLAVAEQSLGQREEERCHENGHFDRTATKLCLTLSHGKEKGDMGSLRRLLKDALTQNSAPDANKNCRVREKKLARRAKDEEHRPCSSEEPASEECKLEDRGHAEDSTKSGEGECSTPWSPSLSVAGPATHSDSNASSRETSPGSHRGGHGVPLAYCGVGDSPQNASAALPLLTQLVGEMRQLLTLSQRGTSPVASRGSSPQGSPRSNFASAVASASGNPEMRAQQPPATNSAQGDYGRVQDILDLIGPARKGVAANIIMVEKMLRGLERDLRKYCEDVLGRAELEVNLVSPERGVSDIDNEDVAYASAVDDEAKKCLPLGADGQIISMSALRRAQQRSSALLSQFVQLPQKLKDVFDLTKKLGNEAQATLTHVAEQRQSFHVELLQKRLHTLALKVTTLQGGLVAVNEDLDKDEDTYEADAAAATKEIQEESRRGISQEDQLLAARTRLHRLVREISCRSERVKSLEEEVVDLHISRHTERAQCLAMIQQTAGLPKSPAAWPWMLPLGGSMPDFADQAPAGTQLKRMPCQQAWGPSAQGFVPNTVDWPKATCVA